jgi:glycosyltransferase involved in cell wall biosynthesis
MAKVTVLTPVYNAEAYLRQCLDSLREQTLADCQFICIDDCSTDGSYALLQEYARADQRFQVLQTPVNSGRAKARNLGLRFAQGEYIATLDADDWFEPDTLERACQALKEKHAQCAVLQLMLCEESDGSERSYPLPGYRTEWSGEEAFRLSLDWSLHGVYVANASLYKRFPFEDTCLLYSDENTTRLHYLNSQKVVLCQGRYNYRQHETSMTKACTIHHFDSMTANLSMKRQIEAMTLNDKQGILNLFETHRWLNLVDCYGYFYQHHAVFLPQERLQIKNLFIQMLSSIERHRIPKCLKVKLGYYPFRSYYCFSLIENLYFGLRKMIGR